MRELTSFNDKVIFFKPLILEKGKFKIINNLE